MDLATLIRRGVIISRGNFYQLEPGLYMGREVNYRLYHSFGCDAVGNVGMLHSVSLDSEDVITEREHTNSWWELRPFERGEDAAMYAAHPLVQLVVAAHATA